MSNEFGEGDYGEPTEIQDVPEVPEVSDIPEISEPPETAAGPIPEADPGDNEIPEGYPEPEIIEEPEVFEEPEVEIPEIDEEPETIEEPVVIVEPGLEQGPEVNGEPGVIEEPGIIEEPEVIEEPVTPEEQEPNGELPEVWEPEIQQAVESLGHIDNLNPGTWDNLTPDERLDTLQNIENTMADIQGRSPIMVVSDDALGENVFGGYNGETIVVNANHLNSDMPVDEFIDTIVHEGRHAYQDYAVNNPGVISNTELVNSWAENQANYLTADEYGQELYVTQPIESDAWSYATTIRNTLIANNWSK